MTANLSGGLRLTVLGNASAAPHLDSPAAGFLVEWDTTRVLLDVGQGVVRALQDLMDPHDLTAVVIGHMHADHYLDLAGLRYLFPWGEPAERPLPVNLPPGGSGRLAALATAISERAGFFDDAYAIREYDPAEPLRIGPLTVGFRRGRHYVPAWAMSIVAPDGARLVYTGDTGPSDSVVDFACDADLLLVEAALRTIPSEQRAALLLRDVEGFDYEEIATITAAELGTVKSRIHRARLAVRNALVAQGWKSAAG
ncbi:MAG: MBL fold metallo-hydrolase [Chloroflexi bacterium]|nr:MBL fold metallo-hydrolase [Chloroflexota bacterium]